MALILFLAGTREPLLDDGGVLLLGGSGLRPRQSRGARPVVSRAGLLVRHDVYLRGAQL